VLHGRNLRNAHGWTQSFVTYSLIHPREQLVHIARERAHTTGDPRWFLCKALAEHASASHFFTHLGGKAALEYILLPEHCWLLRTGHVLDWAVTVALVTGQPRLFHFLLTSVYSDAGLYDAGFRPEIWSPAGLRWSAEFYCKNFLAPLSLSKEPPAVLASWFRTWWTREDFKIPEALRMAMVAAMTLMRVPRDHAPFWSAQARECESGKECKTWQAVLGCYAPREGDKAISVSACHAAGDKRKMCKEEEDAQVKNASNNLVGGADSE